MSSSTRQPKATAIPGRADEAVARIATRFAAHDEMCRVLSAGVFPILWQLVDVMSLSPYRNRATGYAPSTAASASIR